MSARHARNLLSRVFGGGENPAGWAVPLTSVGGVGIRLHVVFVAFIAVRLVQSIQTDNAGLLFQLLSFGGLLALVLLHEAGHVVAARYWRAEHDRVVLWPLGGLSHGEPTGRTAADLGVALGGVAVNLALVPVLGLLLRRVTGSWDLVFFDPLNAGDASITASADGLLAWALWSLHANNLLLLAANLLLPMPPLDCGRLVECVLSGRLGELAAARWTGTIGLAAAALTAFAGLMIDEAALVGVAIVGGFMSWQVRDRASFLASIDEQWTPPPDPADMPVSEPPIEEPDIDRLLEKISEQGIGSLTPEERETLDRASIQKRSN